MFPVLDNELKIDGASMKKILKNEKKTKDDLNKANKVKKKTLEKTKEKQQ